MLTRRRFLSHTALGTLALAGGCAPVSLRCRGGGLETEGRSESAATSPLTRKNLMLGYPVNMSMPSDAFFAWRRRLADAGIGEFAYNNVGNPFENSAMLYNTHDYERLVIRHFSNLYGFSAASVWGFVSNSDTDSNLHGMYMGRTLLKARAGRMPKAYFTAEAHYSIEILQDLLGLERVIVDTGADAGMDPDDLRRKVAANGDAPALVVATTGTTFKGAIDPLDRIRAALEGHCHYLHLDAALFGGYLPYTPHAYEVSHRAASGSAAARYDSIAVSCHKFFGFPAPAGLFMTTAETFSEFHREFSLVHNPEYIRHVPGTITCSRDSVKPAEFHYFTTSEAVTTLAENAKAILLNTDWLFDRMKRDFPRFRPNRMNDRSNTLFFRQPSEGILKKYSLATMQVQMGGQRQHCAHVVVMPHATREILGEFLRDLGRDASVTAG
jgi:histidine decarboxylase